MFLLLYLSNIVVLYKDKPLSTISGIVDADQTIKKERNRKALRVGKLFLKI